MCGSTFLRACLMCGFICLRAFLMSFLAFLRAWSIWGPSLSLACSAAGPSVSRALSANSFAGLFFERLCMVSPLGHDDRGFTSHSLVVGLTRILPADPANRSGTPARKHAHSASGPAGGP